MYRSIRLRRLNYLFFSLKFRSRCRLASVALSFNYDHVVYPSFGIVDLLFGAQHSLWRTLELSIIYLFGICKDFGIIELVRGRFNPTVRVSVILLFLVLS